MTSRRALPAIALLILVAACGPATRQSASPGGPIPVVTTSTVFADLVRNVGGDLVAVTSLAGKNADVHTFEPAPADLRTVGAAKLLVMNGLGLDDWLEKTITNASATGTPLVKLGVELPGVELLPGDAPGTQNPHVWMNVKYAELYVDRIAEALKRVDPPNATSYDTQAGAFKGRLELLDASVRDRIATIPEQNRKLVMFHDAFPYFARAYGITIVGVAVEAPGQDPSAAETAALIQAIRAAGVKAIFSESQFPTKLVDQLARETGATVVADLYDDALGDPPVTSYEAMITWDADKLVAALR
jgi:ABC-type Zn uptake system ZnuABC Zn-binding protein ZnuA